MTASASLKYTASEIHRAARLYQPRNRKVINGCVFYEPRLIIPLEWDEETLCQMNELLACSSVVSYAILQLLSATRTNLPISQWLRRDWKTVRYQDEDFDPWEDALDERYFTERVRVPVERHRYLLSSQGIRRIIDRLCAQHTGEYVGVPVSDSPCTAQEAIQAALLDQSVSLRQVRFILHLNIHYLVSLVSV
ncbi:hypothetical protein [Candidatus Methylomicrobium oryzae]|jgi:hypothetical protein|uniref:hypothetical protein n=1 Tax=Candidatus Methylomicrobium oryzae TaxID=2802053 RepID=UPI001920418C|nr:hypothetical protein [Methylomicrobium sp. RS1]MBL1262764.1 hypothetical protein [Methylomicrobium sp. RS1]